MDHMDAQSFIMKLAANYGVVFIEQDKKASGGKTYTTYTADCSQAVYNKWSIIHNLKNSGLWGWMLENLPRLNSMGVPGIKNLKAEMFFDEKTTAISQLTGALAKSGLRKDKTQKLPQRNLTPDERQVRARHLESVGHRAEDCDKQSRTCNYKLRADEGKTFIKSIQEHPFETPSALKQRNAKAERDENKVKAVCEKTETTEIPKLTQAAQATTTAAIPSVAEQRKPTPFPPASSPPLWLDDLSVGLRTRGFIRTALKNLARKCNVDDEWLDEVEIDTRTGVELFKSLTEDGMLSETAETERFMSNAYEFLRTHKRLTVIPLRLWSQSRPPACVG